MRQTPLDGLDVEPTCVGRGGTSMHHHGFSCARRYGDETRLPVSGGVPLREFSIAMFAASNRKFVNHSVISQAAVTVRSAIRE